MNGFLSLLMKVFWLINMMVTECTSSLEIHVSLITSNCPFVGFYLFLVCLKHVQEGKFNSKLWICPKSFPSGMWRDVLITCPNHLSWLLLMWASSALLWAELVHPVSAACVLVHVEVCHFSHESNFMTTSEGLFRRQTNKLGALSFGSSSSSLQQAGATPSILRVSLWSTDQSLLHPAITHHPFIHQMDGKWCVM